MKLQFFYDSRIFCGDCNEKGIWWLNNEDALEMGETNLDSEGEGLCCFGDKSAACFGDPSVVGL